MRAKRLLTIAGVLFLNLILIVIVLDAVDVSESSVVHSISAVDLFDFGDAPADRYPTQWEDDGARHVPGERWLGSPPDLEPNGLSHPAALGDDLSEPVDDEDGVLFLSPLVAGNIGSVEVVASFEGLLSAWLDFGRNSTWADPEDQIFADEQLQPGPNILNFNVPAGAVPGPTFSRWRFSSQRGLGYETGFEEQPPDGEVEDHLVEIAGQPLVDSWEKWIDGQPWTEGIAFTVETSQTIEVVDVIRTDPGKPFLLAERWEPTQLRLERFAIEPQGPIQPTVDEGSLIWDMPPGHPEVLVLTKWFHVEPCTWESTTLVEELQGLDVPEPIRPVGFVKEAPILGIDALYERDVLSGAPASFILVFSNTGGFENDVTIRNDFPPQAPYVGSVPPADQWDEVDGLWAEWNVGNLAGGDAGAIEVGVEIAPGLLPSTTVNITDYIRNHLRQDVDSVEITLHIAGTAGEPLFDLGDAPDSTNHAGVAMTAYTNPPPAGFPGVYPTVFDPATGLPQGPLHRQPLGDAWLGPRVTREFDADLMPDQDGVPNLDPRANVPDLDLADDGVKLPLLLPDCTSTFITYTVTVSPGAPPIDRFVNVWFDWSRDGDWADILTCATNGDAPEWAVQNQLIPAFPPGTYVFATPAFLPFNKTPAEPMWMRISIAEQPAPLPPDGSLADGRGPANGYAYGETEDYNLPGGGLPPGEWDKLVDGQPWGPGIVYTVETSQTVEVVDVIRTAPDNPFTLIESWVPDELALEGFVVDPPLPVDPIPGDGSLIWEVPPDHPEVITITKQFHVEPCTWRITILREELEGLDVPDPIRPVILDKIPPLLWIHAQYEPDVQAGAAADFTLVYSNTGGRENNITIRNGFPDEAPYKASDPPADRLDPDGLWAEWDLGLMAGGDRGTIDVRVDIAPGLQPSTTVVITDAIRNHLGEVADEVTIRYHVTEPRGWLEGYVMDSETGDLFPTCTHASVDITPGPVVAWADPPTGYYGPVELISGTYTLVASAPGYSAENAVVDIVHEVTTTQDFNLWRPVIVVTPTDFVSVTAYISQPTTTQMTIGNHGHRALEWEILEEAGGLDYPWVWEDPISGTTPSLGEQLVDVTFHCTQESEYAGVLVIDHDDPCEAPVEVPIRLHCRAPQWHKLIDGAPWDPEVSYTVETSDTIEVVDVVVAPPNAPFTLIERWNPLELVLRGYTIDPPLPYDPTGDNGVLSWDVPAGHPETITLTKRFHIEPCTWEDTVLEEELLGLDVRDPVRLVHVRKKPPVLGLNARYEPGILTGTPAQFTLVYSNTGGFENDVVVRNEFPLEAPYASSQPPADRRDPAGLWVEWDVGNLAGGALDTIDVVVDIGPGLVPSTTVVITDYIQDHTGLVVDEVFIEFHVEPPPGEWEKWINGEPWSPELGYTVETSDTIEVVDVVHTSSAAPFVLTEQWDSLELVLLGYTVDLPPSSDPTLSFDPIVDDGILIWDVPGGHPEVITLTKQFHVEPCTWRETILDEELRGLEVLQPHRPVLFVKTPPLLGIDAQYNPEVTAGDLALFTLVYSNTGGYENDVMIRNDFLPEASYVTSVPPADRWDEVDGSWAEWDLGDLAGGSQGSIDVVVGIQPGLQPSTTLEFWDYIYDHTGQIVDEVMITLHIQDPPPGEWDKLINGQPWTEGITFTVETSDTIEVVDVVKTARDASFTLFEEWVPGELRLVEYAFDPPLPFDPITGTGILIWDMLPGHPEVITLTKKFHVEPCTWERTTLAEALQGLDLLEPFRSVTFEKKPPDLRLDSLYEPQVYAGGVATFTLVYSNAGGYENDVMIRNSFPSEALFVDAYPKPDWQAPDGSEVRWELGDLATGDGDKIEVTVAIQAGLVASNTIDIIDYIYNHAGQDVDQTTITYHVDESPPQQDDRDIYIKDNSLDDGSVPSTPPWWAGPDMWVRTDGDCTKATHQNPVAGTTNTICVRVRNRMAATVSNISVDLYYGSAALGLYWPGSYSIAGSAHVASLAGGDETVVAVAWNTPNITGHFCLLARADSPDDPVGSGYDTVSPQDHVPNNNNLSMKNVNIVAFPELGCGRGTTAVDTDVVYLDVVNTTDHAATVDVVFESPDFPLGSGEIRVAPGVLWDRWSSLSNFDQVDHTLIPTAFPASMGGIPMAPYETGTVTVTISAGIDERFTLQVSELVDGELVGGVDYMRLLPYCSYAPLILRDYTPPAPAWLPTQEGAFAPARPQ